LLGFRGQQRLVLSVTLLQRSVAVEIHQEWIQPASSACRSSSSPVACQQSM
jgi:hypothetical protein